MSPIVMESPSATAGRLALAGAPANNPFREPEPDEALALRAKVGAAREAAAAFGLLVQRYEARVVGFIARRCGFSHDAEDLAQEAFLRAWSKIHTYDESRRFAVWMFTIAARMTTSDWRRKQRSKQAMARLRPPEADAAESRGSEPDVWKIAASVLDDDTLSALWLQYVAGLEPGDIARVLGRSGVGVRVMLHRARRKIAAAIEPTPAPVGPIMEMSP